MSSSKANEVERTPTTNEFFYSDHLQVLQHRRERPDMERKYVNSDKAQRKELELTISEVAGGTNIQSKQARVL